MLKSAYTSPKIHALARKLKIPFPHALGICGLLWNFTCDHAPDGNVGKHGALGIATATHWDGDENVLLEALIAVRLIDRTEDGSMVIHQWAEHCPQWVKNKATKGGSDPGRTRAEPRSDPGRTRVDGGSLSISSPSEVLPPVSSPPESPSADEDEAAPVPMERMTRDQITAIAGSSRKAAWLQEVRLHCTPEQAQKATNTIFGWIDSEKVWTKFQLAKNGSRGAVNPGAYWATCVANACKEIRSKR